jgi:hypothetical protein
LAEQRRKARQRVRAYRDRQKQAVAFFNRGEVCALVPVKTSTLAHWMTRHRNDPLLSPPKYIGRARRGRRLWTAADVRYIRASLVRGHQ